MKSGFKVYEELIYGEQKDGSCNWEGHLYFRGRPGGVAEETDGISSGRETARGAFKKWCDEKMPAYAIAEERIVDGAKVFLTQEEVDAEKAAEE